MSDNINAEFDAIAKDYNEIMAVQQCVIVKKEV